ncbi:tyrosine-type recombinase/integrase [Lactococcus sp.]|uniref:tyrosine-type recombinase/integrase n=1 Tax=Lactococcus sp. TaxID=44273 RepID=UPI003FA6078B
MTVLRIGEALRLQWEDIDFEKQTLSLPHTLYRLDVSKKERQLQTPKIVESYRTSTLYNRCIEILNDFRENLKDNSFVFVNKKGRAYGDVKLSIHFKKTCSVLGEENQEKKYTLHMLRHSVSLLIEMGVSIKSIRERLIILMSR